MKLLTLLSCLLLLFTSCKFSRQLAKTTDNRDTFFVNTFDSAAVQKEINKSSEKLKSTTTIVEKQGQPIYLTQPNGETKVIFPPPDRTTQIDMETLNELFRLKLDSVNKQKKDSGGAAVAASDIKTNTKAGFSILEVILAGVVVLFVIGFAYTRLKGKTSYFG